MIPENTPTLETERLILRKLTDSPSDLNAMSSILSDERTNVFLPWFPLKKREEVQKHLKERYFDFYEKESAYRYVICWKQSNVLIGYMGLSDGDSHDFGYGLHSRFWHQGIATEAARAVTERIRQAGFYPFIIGEVGHTNGDYLDWDPQFTRINFFVIMFLNNIIPYINLEIISLPDKLTYYNDDVYAPTGLYIGYTLTLNNEKMPFNIKLLYYTPYYIDNSGNKVNLSASQTKFTNINEGPVTIYVEQVLGDISYQVSYNIEFINKPNPEVADSIIPNDQYIMYFSITLGLIFIVIGAVGLAIHLYLRKRKNK